MDKEMLIRDIFAREILDSRGNPTVRQMAVDLIAEDIDVRAAGNLNDLLQQLPGHQCPGGIVGIVDADHLRVRRHQCTKLVQIGQIAVFLPQIHDGHIGADGCRNRVKLLVGGHDAHYIAGKTPFLQDLPLIYFQTVYKPT